jgi:hypothetical protein
VDKKALLEIVFIGHCHCRLNYFLLTQGAVSSKNQLVLIGIDSNSNSRDHERTVSSVAGEFGGG